MSWNAFYSWTVVFNNLYMNRLILRYLYDLKNRNSELTHYISLNYIMYRWKLLWNMTYTNKIQSIICIKQVNATITCFMQIVAKCKWRYKSVIIYMRWFTTFLRCANLNVSCDYFTSFRHEILMVVTVLKELNRTSNVVTNNEKIKKDYYLLMSYIVLTYPGVAT